MAASGGYVDRRTRVRRQGEALRFGFVETQSGVKKEVGREIEWFLSAVIAGKTGGPKFTARPSSHVANGDLAGAIKRPPLSYMPAPVNRHHIRSRIRPTQAPSTKSEAIMRR